MDREAMSNEENYCFDSAGYLIVRGALSRNEISGLNQAIDQSGREEGMLGWSGSLREPFRDLLIHPHLVWYLNQIIGYGFRLDQEPELLGVRLEDVGLPLVGGNEPRVPGRAYYFQNGRRYCQAVRVIWALGDVNEGDGGFVMVPCSHKSNVETPQDVLTGRDDMGLTFQPELKAGDLLLVAGAVLQGLQAWKGSERQRLLSYEYVGRGVVQSVGTGPKVSESGYSEWMDELSPEQRASVYRPGYRDTTPPPTLVTDGERISLDGDQEVFHPSIYIRDPNTTIDEKEFYFWDLCGYLVLRGVMDEEWLKAANEAIDKFEHMATEHALGMDYARGSKSLAGNGIPNLGGTLQFPPPYCEPFRKMMSHPVVEHRLNWMGGSGRRCGGPTGFVAAKGNSGHALHDCGEPMNPPMGFQFQNGRSYSEAVTATWQLRDVEAGLGGFACVPGSHKANYPIPPGVRMYDDHMGLVVQPVMNAGDVIVFADGATTHGSLAWKNDLPRRGMLIKYSSRSFNRSGGDLVHPENRWGDLVEGMTDAQLAVVRGSDRDGREFNVPRLIVENGRIEVSYERGNTLYSDAAPKEAVIGSTERGKSY